MVRIAGVPESMWVTLRPGRQREESVMAVKIRGKCENNNCTCVIVDPKTKKPVEHETCGTECARDARPGSSRSKCHCVHTVCKHRRRRPGNPGHRCHANGCQCCVTTNFCQGGGTSCPGATAGGVCRCGDGACLAKPVPVCPPAN